MPKTTNVQESFLGNLKEKHRGMSHKHYQNYVKRYMYFGNVDTNIW